MAELTVMPDRSVAASGRASRRKSSSEAIGEMVRAVADGDRHVFRDLYGATSAFVFGILLSILRDRSRAEEVAQEVYVAIWRKAALFDGKAGEPLSWIAAIARNRAIDRLRADRARGDLATVAELPEIADQRPSVETILDGHKARAALDEIRPEFRQAVVLVYFGGYSYAEVGQMLDVPIGTAKSWVRRGVAAVKEQLV